MKQYSFAFRNCTRSSAPVPESCKDLKGMFKYEQIPDGAFSGSVMRRLQSAKDGTVVWIKTGYFTGRHSWWCRFGIKVTDLAERLKNKKRRLEVKKQMTQLEKELESLKKDKAVLKFFKIRARIGRLALKL